MTYTVSNETVKEHARRVAAAERRHADRLERIKNLTEESERLLNIDLLDADRWMEEQALTK